MNRNPLNFSNRTLCGLICLTLFWTPIAPAADQTVGSVAMPTQEDDRGKSQNGASAMAMAAAAMQQVMCLKMMADAQAEGNSEKMAMASMMCAQAAANAANAAQNKEGAKKVSSNLSTPNAPSFEKPNIDTQAKADNFNPALLNSGASAKTDDKKDSEPELSFGKTDETQPGDVYQDGKKAGNFGAALSVEDPKPAPTSTISLKDSVPDSSRPSLLGTSMGMGNSLAPSTGSLPASLKSGTSESKEPEDANALKKRVANKGVDSNAGAGGNLEDLMAKYMNGAGAFGNFNAASLGGSGVIDLAFGLQTPGKRSKTIFEFASEQYQKSKPSAKREISSKN